MKCLQRWLHALLIGAFVSCGVLFWWFNRSMELSRIDEVRSRVEPGLKREMRSVGFHLGDPAYIRIFKESRELELWLRPKWSKVYRLYRTYPTHFSGELGPKLAEGDGQAPEGFYEVTERALNPLSNFHLSFNIGYPNAFDQSLGRTGSFIMVHGGWVSVGCFAMTDPVIEVIYLIAAAALRGGQQAIPVHVFPFRMSDEKMQAMEGADWHSHWVNLQQGYVSFERTHVPPLTSQGVILE